jgi:hypothetical protein
VVAAAGVGVESAPVNRRELAPAATDIPMHTVNGIASSGRVPFPKTGRSKPLTTPPALLLVVRCRHHSIPSAALDNLPVLARASWRIAYVYRYRRIIGRNAPRLSNNDPCTSNCGGLILVGSDLIKLYGVLPIITFSNIDFSAESRI